QEVTNYHPLELPYSDNGRIATWAYDSYGNLIKEKIVYSPDNHRITTWVYDSDGILVEKNTVHNSDNGTQTEERIQYEYTGWGHLFFDLTLISEFASTFPVSFMLNTPVKPAPVIPTPVEPVDPLSSASIP
ncbi:MAG: hypothetical protein V7742_22650, partial [Halioglobus sp.]